MVDLAINQIREALPAAIETVCAALSEDFPVEICDSIVGGALERLKRMTAAAK